uniref:tRNA threonylcarbamoyladenosine biosynthesis protein TsaE n=1 Tax=uncultured Bacteroidota bacterium TaxID=152509 RepID=H5SNW4_9BACT|nr:ATPase [uncultured Bacteroidetes bacterium]
MSEKRRVKLPWGWAEGDSLRFTYGMGDLPRVVGALRAWCPSISRWMLVGPLGAGKTHFVRAWAGEAVASPTFTYVNAYPQAYHVDLYRFSWEVPSRLAELESLLEEAPLIFVEWAEKLPELPPLPFVWVEIQPVAPQERLLTATLIKDPPQEEPAEEGCQ